MSFGADTDIVGLAADTTAGGWKVIGSTKAITKEEAQAEDSNGDIAESTMYNTLGDRTVTYLRTGNGAISLQDTGLTVDYRLGKVLNGFVIKSLALETSNKERPKLTIGLEPCSIADSLVRKFPVTALNLAAGTRKAHKLGFTVAANNKLLSSSITAEVQVARELDETGSTAVVDVHAGRVNVTGNFVGVTAAPGATADTGWTLNAGPSEDKSNTAYATGSISVFKNLAPSA